MSSPPLSHAQKTLHKLGLQRDIDLALHIPLRYEDETRLQRLADSRDGDTLQFEATVTHCQVGYRPKRQLLVTVADDDGETCVLRFFNFFPAQQKSMAEGQRLRIRGELRGGMFGRTMMHPVCKAAGTALPQALTPVYPTSAGLAQNYLRKAIDSALQRADLSDTVPQRDATAQPWQKCSLREALHFLHHPTPDTSIQALTERSHPAWQRLKAEELLAQQLSQWQARRERSLRTAPVLGGTGAVALVQRLRDAVPFALTGAQQRCVAEIGNDLQGTQPMHRLLQGDVGSGKTVVAALAAAQCMGAGWQCALMAPTEILAEQHFRKLVDWLSPLGITTVWLTGSQGTRERRAALAQIERGEAQLVVGTHAVIQEKVHFARLALAVIDEQHRFGVAQRLALRSKNTGQPLAAAVEPHLLMMTATPIPRTLAMSYYADLEVSTLDELPPGRTPIVTRLVHARRRDQVLARIAEQVAQGRQVYWVCPLIEESEAIDLVNATQTHAELSAALPQAHVGLLHSRMPSADKKAVMAQFSQGQMQVLVSTTVIEVGVDVPNATLMVVEHAERFGLSQLHQLRGRVGRGSGASACVLLYATGDAARLSDAARARLQAMADTHDGFEIARRDLDIRGPGEFLGARQSGAPLLRFADLGTDTHLLEWAREQAPWMWQHTPDLAQAHLQRWLGGKAAFLRA